MAESHARLSLHPSVLVADALAAILLFEENTTAQTGYSHLCVEPDPHLIPWQDEHQVRNPASIGKSVPVYIFTSLQLVEHMQRFRLKLEQFLLEYEGEFFLGSKNDSFD